MKKRLLLGMMCMVMLLDAPLCSAAGALLHPVEEEKQIDRHIEKDSSFLTMYDFNGTIAPSSRQKASYELGVKDTPDGSPLTGPDIDNATEFTTSDYVKIYKPDGARADARSPMGRLLQWFRFVINESPSDITNLYVHWYGHASNTPVDLYIWNYHATAWELVGVDRLTSTDAAISKTYVNDITQYIDPPTGRLTLVAITSTTTRGTQTLSTNYVQLKVGNPSTTTLQDDAYHFHHEKTYVEWWFFQVVDTAQDVQCYISYYLISPALGFAAMNMGVFEQEQAYEITQIFPVEQFAASYETPAVSIGKDCSFHARNDTTFIVKGKIDDRKHHAQWNLTFTRTAPPYDFMESPGEMQYLCYLPGASVNGTITLNGVTYTQNCSYGYHDHNWGGAPHLLSQWAWAAVCDPRERFALVMEKVEHFTWHTRSIFLTVGNETLSFDDIQTTFHNYTFDVRLSFPFFTYYPKQRHIEATNRDGYSLSFDAIVQKNLPIWMGIPHRLNEQVSLFQGTLSKNGQTLYSFQVLGFTDYSTY